MAFSMPSHLLLPPKPPLPSPPTSSATLLHIHPVRNHTRTPRFKCASGQTGFFTKLGRLIQEKAMSGMEKIFSGFSKTRDNLAVIDELLLYWNLSDTDRVLDELEESVYLGLFAADNYTNRLKKEGTEVVLKAGDTFRAAATDQLEIWAERTGCEIVVAEKENVKASSVLSQAVKKGREQGFDVVLCDKTGRLHTDKSLMEELVACKKAVGKAVSGTPNEILQVLDGTTGLNMLLQAREFNDVVGVTGLILTLSENCIYLHSSTYINLQSKINTSTSTDV